MLAPTDEAFAAANISSYLNHTTSNAALLDLLKLHILPSRTPIPTDPKVATRSAATRMFPPKADSRPLAIEDDVSYLTLLSATSRFGDLAFREIRSSDTFVVGIKGARGIELNDWADVGQSGRATPVWNDDDEVKVAAPIPAVKNRELVNGVTLGGGVFVIECVLPTVLPFERSTDPLASAASLQLRARALSSDVRASLGLDGRGGRRRRVCAALAPYARRVVALAEATIEARDGLRARRGGGGLIRTSYPRERSLHFRLLCLFPYMISPLYYLTGAMLLRARKQARRA